MRGLSPLLRYDQKLPAILPYSEDESSFMKLSTTVKIVPYRKQIRSGSEASNSHTSNLRIAYLG